MSTYKVRTRHWVFEIRDDEELLDLAQEGYINPTDWIQTSGSGQWTRVEQHPVLTVHYQRASERGEDTSDSAGHREFDSSLSIRNTLLRFLQSQDPSVEDSKGASSEEVSEDASESISQMVPIDIELDDFESSRHVHSHDSDDIDLDDAFDDDDDDDDGALDYERTVTTPLSNLQEIAQNLASSDSIESPDVPLTEEASEQTLPRIKPRREEIEPNLMTLELLAPEEEPTPLGTMGRFTLMGPLGEGGIGQVFLAYDPLLCRCVALKKLRSDSYLTSDQTNRFIAEAQITAQLEHPNIVPVHELIYQDDQNLYYAMKHMQGRSLREILTALHNKHLATVLEWTQHRLLSSFVQICNAIGFAHRKEVLHRDLKPSNIMMGAFGEVSVVDWGLARLIGDRSASTQSTEIQRIDLAPTMIGSVVGTPGYMSPEQALGETDALDERADVWSLGAILYEILTLTPPYYDENPVNVLYESTHNPPEDPRLRAPNRRIADELAELSMHALALNRDKRLGSAKLLALGVEDILGGGKRRRDARERFEHAQTMWSQYLELHAHSEQLHARAFELAHTLPPWLSVEEKSVLFSVRRQIDASSQVKEQLLSRVMRLAEQALVLDPEYERVREFLAEIHWQQLTVAESEGNARAVAYLSDRVTFFDPHQRYADALAGFGSLNLDSDPSGARVTCNRFKQEGTVWELTDFRDLGVTPIRDFSLPMGSYLLSIEAPGHSPIRYPINITRSARWDAEVKLYPSQQVPKGFVLIPGGPFLSGGDPLTSGSAPKQPLLSRDVMIARYPVTFGEYLEFLNDLQHQDPEAAARRVPGSRSNGGLATLRDGRWELRHDILLEGATRQRYPIDAGHDERFPLFCVNIEDALAYIEWRSARDNRRYRLPLSSEWEKAARGVDGRFFPWGNTFDATLCKMQHSRPEIPQPEPVGAFESDESVYGVCDLAGSIREWCLNDPNASPVPYRGPQASSYPTRGGGWNDPEQMCRLANKRDMFPSWRVATVGFRLATDPSHDAPRGASQVIESTHQALISHIAQMFPLLEKADAALHSAQRDPEAYRSLLLEFSEHTQALVLITQRVQLQRLARILTLCHDVTTQAMQNPSRSHARRYFGSLWDALTTIRYLLNNADSDTVAVQDILIWRLRNTLGASKK